MSEKSNLDIKCSVFRRLLHLTKNFTCKAVATGKRLTGFNTPTHWGKIDFMKKPKIAKIIHLRVEVVRGVG